jgi:hypothetical protein
MLGHVNPIETANGVGVTEEPYPSNFYAWYCVTPLMGIYVNSFLDRSILARSGFFNGLLMRQEG